LSRLNEKLMVNILAHAEKCYPKECCGLIVMIKRKNYYRPCKNISSTREQFEICPRDFIKAEEEGEILTVVHSHCNRNAEPSEADKVGCEKSGLPWLIVSWPTKQIVEIKPDGYELPLSGREFSYGVIDCYTLIQDVYRRELQIELPDVKRPTHGWWKKGEDFYMNNFTDAGFEKVSKLEKYCVILMQIGSDVANHSAVYLGDNIILQHLENRLSGKEPYGGYWEKHTRAILKHGDLKC